MSDPAGWYAQPEGKESYWDGQEWIAVRDPRTGPVPTKARGMSTRRIVLIMSALAVLVGALAWVLADVGQGCGSALFGSTSPSGFDYGDAPWCNRPSRLTLFFVLLSASGVLFWLSTKVENDR
ncbi:MAG: hypothetical protein HHJ11_17610 [Phycicoccus sp.]|nr:hypothetical protein [Phycicoccus sp.]